MEHLHNDIKRRPKFGAEPRLAQAPDQILPICVEDAAETLTVVLAEWQGGRFLTGMVLLALWLLS